jgi:hypothetical protein
LSNLMHLWRETVRETEDERQMTSRSFASRLWSLALTYKIHKTLIGR